MKKKKCENCGDPIPLDLEKYIKAKIVCDKCYYKLKTKTKELNGYNQYLKWLKRK